MKKETIFDKELDQVDKCLTTGSQFKKESERGGGGERITFVA